jgi:hypothetical protein
MRCQRCQGCMINDQFMDILNGTGEMDFRGWRCMNCGAITDPVIVRHHQSAASIPTKSRRRWWGALSYVPVRDEVDSVLP